MSFYHFGMPYLVVFHGREGRLQTETAVCMLQKQVRLADSGVIFQLWGCVGG
jgi:hypothetical protein